MEEREDDVEGKKNRHSSSPVVADLKQSRVSYLHILNYCQVYICIILSPGGKNTCAFLSTYIRIILA